MPTAARWMRQFVASHPDYKQDSVISDKINYDLITKIQSITKGECSAATELTGRITSRVHSAQRPLLPRRISVQSEAREGEGANKGTD